MAAATAAIGSCFSATTTPIFHFHSKLASSDSMLRVARIPALQSKPTLTTNVIDQYLVHSTMVVYKHRVMKMSATVAQDEAQVEEAEAVVEEGGEKPEEEERVAELVEVQNTKLYFGNLPYNCDSALLAGIIQEYASPEMVEVLYDRDTGRSRGFAFVTMSSVEDCEAVIQNLDGSQYGGRTLRVNFSDKPKSREPLYPESEFKLFVGNLSWSVTSESLTEVFQEYGNVVGARVLYDGDTGRSRGYGFVCYSSKQEMDVALESLNGEELEGRDMRISLALGKKNY